MRAGSIEFPRDRINLIGPVEELGMYGDLVVMEMLATALDRLRALTNDDADLFRPCFSP
jgi:hypothetical protein